MDLPVLDNADARKRMVDSQIRPNKVNDAAVLDAMRTLQREMFLPASLASSAYIDDSVPLGRGRVLLEPMYLARLLQAAAVVRGERALVVASGTGYAAALLQMIGAEVTAVEDDPELRSVAARALPPHVRQVSGQLEAGAPQYGPYDVILIEGGVRKIPEALAAQLAPKGRILTVIVPDEGVGIAVRADAHGGALAITKLFDCQTPPLPSLLPKPGFSFD